VFLDVVDQLRYLSNFPELATTLPWNCIQRRNVSFLYAYEQGADVIITIDDDNFIMEGDTASDFIGAHLRITAKCDIPVVSSDSGWFNVCDFLSEERGIQFYHRGYPPGERWKKPAYTVRRRAGGELGGGGV
jgi:hypothetical protein